MIAVSVERVSSYVNLVVVADSIAVAVPRDYCFARPEMRDSSRGFAIANGSNRLNPLIPPLTVFDTEKKRPAMVIGCAAAGDGFSRSSIENVNPETYCAEPLMPLAGSRRFSTEKVNPDTYFLDPASPMDGFSRFSIETVNPDTYWLDPLAPVEGFRRLSIEKYQAGNVFNSPRARDGRSGVVQRGENRTRKPTR